MSSPTFPAVRIPVLADVQLPTVMRVRLPQPKGTPVDNLESAIEQALSSAIKLNALPSGARIAVGVGSRGLTNLPGLVAGVVAYLKGRGHNPFIVPAMGSHGGATAEGQAAVLERLGVSEATVGAPVRATMETVEFGTTSQGIPCMLDANAAAADGIVTISRVKSHTSFDRPIESGLVKMVAVGLGKDRGANYVHRMGPPIGLGEVLPEIGRVLLDNAPMVCGLAVVENAHHDIVTVEAVEPESFHAADERLLKLAKSLLARLPFAQIDAMIVEVLGKEISGAGMDYAVTGRTDIRGVPNPPKPFIHKIGVLGCTPESHGNGMGVGMADYIPRALANSLDLQAMYMNSIVATILEKARIPIVLPDERDVARALALTSWCLDPAQSRFCIIRSTMHLNEILVSNSLFEDIAGTPGVEVLSDLAPMEFSDDGVLLTRC
ncbi:MAG: DUF2088 domain-containing protein [Rhodospirillales bacterium]|nr:DUF2088 domain-containing protein [Rhodospirillales bacterium]